MGEAVDKLSYLKARMRKSISESPNNSYKSPDSTRPDKITLLNKEGTGLSEEVESLLRNRLLKDDMGATAPLYQAYGLEKDVNGVWSRPSLKTVKVESPEEAPENTDSYDQTETPVDDIRDLKLRYMRSRRYRR